VLAAWLMLGESVTAVQAFGGVVVLIGLALARQGDRSREVTAAAWPDAGALEGTAAVAAGGRSNVAEFPA
jgi:hypothetical protein